MQVNTNEICPICRKSLDESSLVIIDGKNEKKSREIYGVPEEIIHIHSNLKKKFGTKIETLLSELTSIQDEKKNSKCLIFSQWSEMFNQIKSALDSCNISYAQLNGTMSPKQRADAINEFQNDKNINVFLLSLRSGAVGLTLTVATTIFIMEPCLNESLEEQAVNRCHRIGQSQEVTVKKFITLNTVEEKLHKLHQRFRNSKGTPTDSMNATKETKNYKIEELMNLFIPPETLKSTIQLEEMEEDEEVLIDDHFSQKRKSFNEEEFTNSKKQKQ
jgi:SNF2 family DNA or RNA helicase